MKLFNFLHQNHQQRAAIVLEQGNFIMVRSIGTYSICLYSVNNFFAEVWYRKRDNKVELVRGFKSIGLLGPYLEMVKLNDLVVA